MALIEGFQLPTLTSPRLRLRWIAQADADALFRIFSDPRAMRYWSSPPWSTPSDAAKYITGIHQSFAEQTLFQWGIARLEDDGIVGTCTLAAVDACNRRAEIGFILRSDCWGTGYMTEAATSLLTFAFETLELHRIEADVDPRNTPSIKLLERLGFQREGYLRERWLVNDEVNDTVFLGLLRREWAGRA